MISLLSDENIQKTPLLPVDEEGGPVFDEPWQAKAFAITLNLYQLGIFDWNEWVEVFSDEIKIAQAAGDPDLGDTYYLHWLSALEKIVAAKNVGSLDALASITADWRAADANRGFGEAPVYVAGAGNN